MASKSKIHNDHVEIVKHDEILLAMIVRSNFDHKGASFFTNEKETLQLGYFRHPKGYRIKPHVHKKFVRQTANTQEVLYIKSGHVRVDFYAQDQSNLNRYIDLFEGDWIILLSGGHGFKMIEETSMIEVKNGPYAGDNDKTRFGS